MIPIQLLPINNASIPGVGGLNSISNNAPQVPPAIASLPPGTLLQGFVLNRSPSGQPILRTNFGDFLIQSNVFLKIGSEVTIKIQTSGANFRADIIEVDGKTANSENVATQKAAPGASQGQQGQNAAANSRDAGWPGRQDTIQQSGTLPTVDAKGNVQGNFQFQAALLSPSPIAASLQLQQGAALILRLLNLQVTQPNAQPGAPQTPTNTAASGQATTPASTPATTTASTSSAATASTAQSSTPAAGGKAAAAPNAATGGGTAPVQAITGKAAQTYQQHQPGSNIASTNAQTAAPTANTGTIQVSASNLQQLSGQTHTLTVIGHEKDGEPVLKTPFGLVKITSRANLPTGSVLQSQITLDPEALNNPLATTQTTNTGGQPPASLFKLAHQWPALEQVLKFLGAGQSELGSTPLPISALPQISLSANAATAAQPAPFSGGLFLFFAALKSGDFRNFLGERNIQKLQQAGQQNLLNQVQAEFSQLSRLATDTSGHQWQTTFFPLVADGEVQMVRWFNKQQDESQKDGKREVNSTRFIVEVDTSMLGELQLDGLYRYEESNNKLELVLRSHSPLDNEIQQAIRGIVQDISDTTGVRGNINFQTTPQFPELPLEDALKDIPDVMA